MRTLFIIPLVLMSLVSSVNADTDIKYGKYICRELVNVYFDKGKIKKQTPDEDAHVFGIMEKVIVEHRKNINDKVEYYEYERRGEKYTHLDHDKIRGVKVDYALRTIVFKHPFLSLSVSADETIWVNQYKCQFLE